MMMVMFIVNNENSSFPMGPKDGSYNSSIPVVMIGSGLIDDIVHSIQPSLIMQDQGGVDQDDSGDGDDGGRFYSCPSNSNMADDGDHHHNHMVCADKDGGGIDDDRGDNVATISSYINVHVKITFGKQ